MVQNFPGLTRLTFIAALLYLLPVFGIAADVENLFEADVPVTGQQPELRTGYVKTALEEVLVRVTGQREVLNRPAVQPMLANPERYVEQYRYYTQPDSTPPQLMLRVRFDGAAIQQALQQHGVAYWGSAERPEILVWLAVEDLGQRYIVSAQDDTEAHREMQQAARERGLPLIFPLMDLEEQGAVDFADVWGGFFEGVQSASERYHAQAVLIGRLNRAAGGWVARWDTPGDGDAGSWSGKGEDLGVLLQAGLDRLSGQLASRLETPSPAGTEAGTINVTVEGVNTLAAFARVDDYLASLSAIRRAALERVEGSSLRYALQLNGTLEGLTQAIAIGTVLEPATEGAPGTFRLRP